MTFYQVKNLSYNTIEITISLFKCQFYYKPLEIEISHRIRFDMSLTVKILLEGEKDYRKGYQVENQSWRSNEDVKSYLYRKYDERNVWGSWSYNWKFVFNEDPFALTRCHVPLASRTRWDANRWDGASRKISSFST